MSDYDNLKQFWNSNKLEPEKYEGKWVENEVFNRVLSENLKDAKAVLDFGCGFGWGLIEMAFSGTFEKGLGIDPAQNSIDYCTGCAKLSGLENLSFVCGDEGILENYKEGFDFILTVNTLDVVPQEVCDSMMKALAASLKKGKRIAICLNPEFTDEDFEKIGMTFKGSYGYKNGVLRSNRKTHQEWIEYFSKYLNFVEYNTFYLTEGEKAFPPRMMFILQK